MVNVTVSAPPIITIDLAQRLPDGSFHFQISGGHSGQSCLIDACDTLPNWTPLFVTNFSTAPYVDFSDRAIPLNRRFYRSRVLP